MSIKMSKNKVIVKNSVFLATRTVISLAISFYTTRVVLYQLGVSDYGLFTVIYGAVAFFVFIVSAMNDSVQRFISINIVNAQIGNVKNIFKNSFIVYLFAGVIFLLFLTTVRNFVIQDFLNIDTRSLDTAKDLYIIALLSIFISIIQTPFNALVLANEKMSFYAYMAIFDSCSKLAVSYLIAVVPSQKLVFYGFFLLLSNFLVLLIYFAYCFSRFRNLILGGCVDFKIIKSITIFSFWNVFGNFAYVCRSQGINIVINIFFSTIANAAYALSNTLLNAINSLTQSLITAIRPQIFKAFAENDKDRYNILILNGSKYSFSLLFILSCPLLLSTKELLSLWLVNIPEYTIGFVRFFIIVALIDSFSSSIITGIQATGIIKKYQIVVGFFVFISLPITYFLFSYGLSIYVVFIPLIFTSLLNLTLRLYFISSLTTFDFRLFYKSVGLPCITSAIVSLFIGYIINSNVNSDSLFELLFVSALYSFISLLVFFIVVGSKQEKNYIFKFLRNKFYDNKKNHQ